MHNDALISWEQHLRWFTTIKDDSQRQFFVFLQDTRPIGVLNFSQHSAGVLEWGCYLGETNVWPGSGLLLEIAALDFALAKPGCSALYAEVLSFNLAVLKLHRLFGYEETDIRPATQQRHGKPYQIHHFRYTTHVWQAHRSQVLAKLPKQIAAAAALIEFNNE